jgi:hypothetical protein
MPTARGARTLAALALVICVLGLCLLVAFMPEPDTPLATADARPRSNRSPPLGHDA